MAALAAVALLGIGQDARDAAETGRFRAVGLAVAASAILGLFLDRRSPGRPHTDVHSRVLRRPWITLFLVSFVALFVEVMFIRYAGSQVRMFSFYKNIPLISAYLGLGLGCWLGRGRGGHALAFIRWMVPLVGALSLGAGAIGAATGIWAAVGSSEHILGDAVVAQPGVSVMVAGQAMMALFCAVALVAITLQFALLGRLLGQAFEPLPRLAAYTVNIIGSLAGIVLFLVLSWLWAPPWVWVLVGLAPLAWWIADRRQLTAAIGLTALAAVVVWPTAGETVWSPYQKLVGRPLSAGTDGNPTLRPGYRVEISDVFYQVALDLRPAAMDPAHPNPYPHYDGVFAGVTRVGRVLVVGAGTGNDVAAALRAGATHVDAVDIDPAIVAMGRRNHPERPYDDPRVRVIVDDARAAFRKLPAASYDAVVFGLLDSHTQLSMSSVRLDNYVFTRESLASARRLLRPGGHILLTAATFRPWFMVRFISLMRSACDDNVVVTQAGAWVTYACRVDRPDEPPAPLPAAVEAKVDLPTDDWPFLYLPSRKIPTAYLVTIVLLGLASALLLRLHGLGAGAWDARQGQLFLLGAAFLLMEVVAVNRLALLFGTTWIVSAVTIAIVLALIVAANLTLAALGRTVERLAYPGLIASLVVACVLEPDWVVGRGLTASVSFGLAQLLPIYFAGLVFAGAFSAAPNAGRALGANMLGAVVGGWAEYAVMAVGTRALVLLALAAYLGSLLMAVRARKDIGAAAPVEGAAEGAPEGAA
jgi:SAM-dependent methyltransferase